MKVELFQIYKLVYQTYIFQIKAKTSLTDTLKIVNNPN